MKSIKKIINYGILFVSIFFIWNTFLRSSCARVIEYDIGIFDEEFLINKSDFLAHVKSAEEPWETAAEKDLFRYKEGASFKINLIWNEEQERLYKGNNLENQIGTKQQSLAQIQTRYQSAVSRYERAVSEYESQLKRYESDVNYWNSQGGAPEREYQQLQGESVALEKKAKEVNTLLQTVNKLAEENNDKVQTYNNNIEEYNQLFSHAHEFDAGNTDGTEINVYSYDGFDELRTLLVHEFGHVLGIDHLENENSVMFYLLNDNNKAGNLSVEDVDALKNSCRL